MLRLEPANSDFARRVRDSFARQGAMHTLGAELASLRELLFPETKQHFWGQMLDAAAPVQPPKWTKENPPVVVRGGGVGADYRSLGFAEAPDRSIIATLADACGAVDRLGSFVGDRHRSLLAALNWTGMAPTA